MNLYILRHAIAVARGTDEYPNDDRPLTHEGIDKMKQEAVCFPLLVKEIDVIYTSPLSRARETAEIAARSLKAERKVKITDLLLPGADNEALFDLLNKEKKSDSVMIVGHEPHLSFVASSLLGVNDAVVEFKKGALCLIEIGGSVRKGSGTLKWLLQPKQLRSMGRE
ncbi:MAG: phosphohistidine phosphatase SixA [Bacteroidota bacterium]